MRAWLHVCAWMWIFYVRVFRWRTIAGVDSTIKSNPVIKKILHSSLSFWASGQTHFHTCMHQMSHLLRLPDLQHRHTSNDRVGIFLGGWVHGIIGTDHQSQVRLWSDTQQSNIRKHLDSFTSCFSGFICCSLCLRDVIILLISQLTAHSVTHVSSPLNNGNTDRLSTSTACQSN